MGKCSNSCKPFIFFLAAFLLQLSLVTEVKMAATRFDDSLVGASGCCCFSDPILNNGVNFTQVKNTPVPAAIYDGRAKRFRLGWFNNPFETINIKSGCFRATKKWQFFCFTSATHVVGLAVINLGYASKFFIYVFDINNRQLFEISDISLGDFCARIAPNSISGQTTYMADRIKIQITNVSESDVKHKIVFDYFDKQYNLLSGNFVVYKGGEPLVNSREVEPGKVVYTHQNSMYRPSGDITFNGRQIVSFDRANDFATMDFTVGSHAYNTTWNWAAAAGLAQDGLPVAINIAKDIYGGTNVVPVYWLDGTIHRAPDVNFQYDNVLGVWNIQSSDGAINLTFQSIGKKESNVGAALLRTQYTQLIGYYSGRLRGSDGAVHNVVNMIGVAEEFSAKW